MFDSLKIGRVFGIGVFVHPTFWLLPLMVLVSNWNHSSAAELGLELTLVFSVFGCVALHELGHAVAAMGYGIRTRDITLYPIGGVARLENIPERPWPEIAVALAGPAVNVALAVGIAALLAVDGSSAGSALNDPDTWVEAFWGKLFAANVSLVLFNLIPAFPMDGGRVFRAAVSWFTDRVTATQVASVVGGLFALLIAGFGLKNDNVMLPVLAAMVFLMGRTEVAQVRAREGYREAERRAAGRLPFVYPVSQVARRRMSPADGWEYDPSTRLWTEYADGAAVRRVRAE